MENVEKLRIINDAYSELFSAGIIKSKGDFADYLGINRSGLSAAMNGNSKYLTDSLIAKILSINDKNIITTINNSTRIPIIPTEARGGSLVDFAESVHLYDCEMVTSPIKGATYAIQVTGDSMSPDFPSGCQVLIKKINEKAFIEWGKVYVLDTPNGAVIKQIRRTDREGVVECVSLNSAYQPFEIEMRYINGWYRVLMAMALK